jgi:hypothetical protein
MAQSQVFHALCITSEVRGLGECWSGRGKTNCAVVFRRFNDFDAMPKTTSIRVPTDRRNDIQNIGSEEDLRINIFNLQSLKKYSIDIKKESFLSAMQKELYDYLEEKEHFLEQE